MTNLVKKVLLLSRLQYIAESYNYDPEAAHSLADDALMQYINDKDIDDAYRQIRKWYS